MIDGQARRELAEVGRDTERFAVLDGGRGVETSRRVVVASDLGARREQLRDGDTLALTARDSTDDVVADFGVVRVLEAEESEQDVALVVDRLLTRTDTSGSRRSPGRRGERQRLSNGKMGEVLRVIRNR